MRKARIIGIATAAAVLYGIVQDEITVHLSLEYFTRAHPPIFLSAPPALLALGWGILGTIWLGAAFGIVLALVVESEGLPPVPLGQVVRSTSVLLLITAVCAATAGLAGYNLSGAGFISLPGISKAVLPGGRYDLFTAVWCTHMMSYCVGMLGGAILILRFWKERGRPSVLPLVPRSSLGLIRAIALLAVIATIIFIRWTQH